MQNLIFDKYTKSMFKKVSISIIVVLIAVFLYAAFGRKSLTLSKAYIKQKYSLPNSHFIKWKGGEIHYTESGNGFPILMIHGFGGSNYDFKILDSLLNNQYRIIRVDLPGFGMSDCPEVKDAEYIKLYDEYFSFLLDTLHLDSMYVMGNSLGGMMAWNLTVKHPENVKKLVLFNSAGYDMEATLKTANAKIFSYDIVKLLLNRGIPKFLTKKGVSRVFFDGDKLTDEKVTRLNELWNREENLPHIMAMASSYKFLDQSLIKTISCPTLIVWGKYDHVVLPQNANRFHQDIKNSKLVVYDSCGHVPMMEKPLEVQRDVLSFFNEKH
jgi:pimeloyl-ACP methyl ester carboxylesterase